MAEKLIKHLKDLCNNDKNLDPLLAQWLFDEKQIRKALQNIQQIFPHYSRHDESHSIQILINIERILGDNRIDLLTPTDTWLLLESAYYHDIGMVIPIDKIKEDWISEEFQDYISWIANTNSHELNEIAIKIKNKDFNYISDQSLGVISFFSELKNVFASFYRSKHSKRSEEIILDPWKKISLDSPRNELIPKRLFEILGKICSYHGESFETVMTLPFKEVGLGNSDAHPRFIACLLRLGDLLDLDNNRFCPVMLRTVGDIPISSKAHIDKHASTKHFRMDENRIEVFSECLNYESYVETDKWLSYLRSEISQQMSCWQDIVPERRFGLLPTVGELNVKLSGYEIISGNDRPKFMVNQEKIFELLQGASIYEKPIQAIRELLQNAVDATLIRVWSENNDLKNDEYYTKLKYSKNINFISPINLEVKDEFNKYPIIVSINKNLENNSKSIWSVSIFDSGIGISKEDLIDIQKIGSSYKNSYKNKIISKMPNWMRPSGAFGIGLQSAFLLSEKINIKTKSYFSLESFNIELNNPKGKNGNIFISKLDKKHRIGTTIEIEIEEDNIPDEISYNKEEDNITMEIIRNFDPISDKAFDIKIGSLIDEIIKFSRNSFIPINIIYNSENLSIDKHKDDDLSFFDDINNISLSVIPESKVYNHRNLYYRGQLVSKSDIYFSFLNVTVNILGMRADEILTLNRNSLRKEHINIVYDQIMSSIYRFVHENPWNEEESKYISAFLEYYNNQTPNFELKWKNLKLGDFEIKDILEKDTIYFKENLASNDSSVIVENNGDKLTITFSSENSLISLLFKFLNSNFKGFQYSEVLTKKVDYNLFQIDRYIYHYSFEKNDFKDPFTDETLKHELVSILKENNSYYLRNTLPCMSQFKKLALKEKFILIWSGRLSKRDKINKRMIFPFTFKNSKIFIDNLDKVCEYCYENRDDLSITLEQIKECYKEFIIYIDNLMKDNKDWMESKDYKI